MMNKRPAILPILLAVVAAFTVCAAAWGQVEPAAVGTSAKFDYSLSYSQMAEFYSAYSGPVQYGTPSGEVEYMNGKGHTPFSLTYAGGYIASISGPATGTGFFQHLLLSQGYATRHGSVSLKDELSFYPRSPIGGFSGIPGVGSFPGLPGPPINPILSLNVLSLNNAVTVDYSHTLNYDTTFNFDASYDSMRFPDGGGLDVNEISVRPQVSWRLNALNSASVQYAYSRFNYLGSTFTMNTQSVQPGFYRVWNRRVTTSVSAGPEWLQSNNDQVFPSSLGLAANAGISYTARSTSASLNYYRAVTTGAGMGAEIGIRSNDVTASISRKFGRDLTVGFLGSYMSMQGLLQPGVTGAESGGVNASKRWGQYITGSVDYTLIHQTSSLPLEASALNGLVQTISFNIAYHPREKHITSK